MKKEWLSMMVGILLFLGMISAPALALYESDVVVEVSGQVAEWDMYGDPLMIEIGPENLYPGCEYTTEITITNDSDVPAQLIEIIVNGCPAFLGVDFPITADWLAPWESGVTEIRLFIDISETEEIAGELISLEITFHYEQGV